MSITASTNETETAKTGEAMPVRAEDELRQEAIATLKRKRKFAKDLFAYVSVNGVLWLIWALTDRSTDGGIPWPAWVSIIWGFLLAVDAWRTFGRWPGSLHRPITEEDIEREMRRSQPPQA
jgi:hypothetical protein